MIFFIISTHYLYNREKDSVKKDLNAQKLGINNKTNDIILVVLVIIF